MTYTEISKIIRLNNRHINNYNLDLISKYLNALQELNIIRSDEELMPLIEKVTYKLCDIEYYSSSDKFRLKTLGISYKNKGLIKDKVLYINGDMSSEMQVITLFHELTHLLQKFEVEGKEECIGVMQDYKWRLLMEAQTQNIAEMVYEHITGDYHEEEIYPSEDLRMLEGGFIRSNLRNYQMYDYILKKICIILDMSIKDFIRLNFMEQDAMKMLEDRIISMYDEDIMDVIWQVLDVIYSTDAIIYTAGNDLIREPYFLSSLVDNYKRDFSSKNQLIQTEQLDRLFLYITQDNKTMHSRLLPYQFKTKKEDLLKMIASYEEQKYTTHLENGVELVYKAS